MLQTFISRPITFRSSWQRINFCLISTENANIYRSIINNVRNMMMYENQSAYRCIHLRHLISDIQEKLILLRNLLLKLCFYVYIELTFLGKWKYVSKWNVLRIFLLELITLIKTSIITCFLHRFYFICILIFLRIKIVSQ